MLKRWFCYSGLFLWSAIASWAVTVQEIHVERLGVGTVDKESVLAFVSVKVGDELSREAIARDVKALEKSGRFSYVATDVETVGGGVSVVYKVKSKPRIRRLVISGADDVSNKKVRELLELSVGDLVDDATIGTKAQKVKEHYRKRHFPSADLTWTIDEDKETGAADVEIVIDEGKAAKVRDIDFTGNESVKDRAIRKVMKQKRWNLFSWLTTAGTYKPDELETDVETIRRLYLDRGYLDVKVSEPVITMSAEKSMEVTISVDEGSLYHMGAIDVKGITLFKVEDVMKVVTNKSGDVASLAAIEKTAQAIQDYYGSRGYINSAVNYRMDPNLEQRKVDITYDVKEGKLSYIRDIHIRGNVRTKDKVIRRELTVYPGAKFNQVKIRNSERRLRNLGYFSFATGVPEETADPEKYDLAFEVEEQKTGQFVIGTGYSSIDDLIGFAELSQGNFDLFNWPPTGGGQKLKLRGTAGTKRKDIELSFVEPWFMDRKLSLGVDLFQRERSYLSDEYDQRNTGINLSLGKPLGNFNRVNLIYGLEEISIFDVDDEASQLIKDEEGTRLKSSLTLELVHDSRDSAFVPTRGNRSSISGMVAGGPLAGETDIYGFEAQASQYWSIWFDHVLNLKAWAATVEEYGDSDRVPIFDRLFLGGARTLRGFKYREVGPKDEAGEPIGGKTAAYLTLEYTIPIVDKIRFAVYYDIGMAYLDAYEIDTSNLNSDVGIGLRLDFPGFPLRLDYAWPLETDEFNDRDTGRFQFSVGYTF